MSARRAVICRGGTFARDGNTKEFGTKLKSIASDIYKADAMTSQKHEKVAKAG